MKLKKPLFFIVVIILVFAFSLNVAAYSVGEGITFNANNIQQQTDGYTNTVTRTEEEQFMDNANWSNNYQVDQIYQQMVSETADNDSFAYQYPDRLLVTYNVPMSVTTLEPITHLMNDYYMEGYGYYIDNTNGWEDQYSNSVSLSGYDQEELRRLASYYGYSTYDSIFGSGGSFDPLNGYRPHLTTSEITTLIQRLSLINGEEVREIDLGDTTIRDFTNYPERWQALDMYLNAMGSEDSVMTQRILEIKVNSKSESALWQSTPQTWGYTGQTHFWEFECIDSYDGNYHAPLTLFGGPRVSQAFYFPGKYQVSATQILNQKYCDVISYDVNEYWIIADTGQVIYKSESNGSYLPDTEEPLSELDLYQVSNTRLIDEGTYYVPVLSQVVEVTSSSWNFDMSAPGVWGYNFSSQRIE